MSGGLRADSALFCLDKAAVPVLPAAVPEESAEAQRPRENHRGDNLLPCRGARAARAAAAARPHRARSIFAAIARSAAPAPVCEGVGLEDEGPIGDRARCVVEPLGTWAKAAGRRPGHSRSRPLECNA